MVVRQLNHHHIQSDLSVTLGMSDTSALQIAVEIFDELIADADVEPTTPVEPVTGTFEFNS